MSAVGNVLRQLIAMGYGTGGTRSLADQFDAMPEMPRTSAGSAGPMNANAPLGPGQVRMGDLLNNVYQASFQQDPPTRDRIADHQNLDVARGVSNDGTVFYYPTRPASGRAMAMGPGAQMLGEVDPRYGRLRAEVDNDRRVTQERLRNLRNLVRDRDTSTASYYNTDNNAGFDFDVAEAVGGASFENPPQVSETPQRRRNPAIRSGRAPMAQALGNLRDRDESSGSIF